MMEVMDFFMNWIAGLPISIGQRSPTWVRIFLMPISLVWVPAMFLLFLPLLALWAMAVMVKGYWDLMQ